MAGSKIAPIRPDGSFVIDLPIDGEPYDLLVTAQGRDPTRPWREWRLIEIGASGDRPTLVIDLARATTIRGRVAWSGGAFDPKALTGLRVLAHPIDSDFEWPPAVSYPVRLDGTFEIPGVLASSVIGLSGAKAGELYVKEVGTATSSLPGGRIEAAAPVETGVVLDVYPRVSQLQGKVDGVHSPVVVALFPTDERLWNDPIGRFTRTVLTSDDGVFELGGLPNGTYTIVALSSVDAGQMRNAALLRKLARSVQAVRVLIGSVPQKVSLPLCQWLLVSQAGVIPKSP